MMKHSYISIYKSKRAIYSFKNGLIKLPYRYTHPTILISKHAKFSGILI